MQLVMIHYGHQQSHETQRHVAHEVCPIFIEFFAACDSVINWLEDLLDGSCVEVDIRGKYAEGGVYSWVDIVNGVSVSWYMDYDTIET